ncbi:MAG TPA: hypothetical protein VFE37_06245 [Chloroflexota bacterium]|nr:hypothetical protein [Chloroflexota bacterium]
MRADMMDEGTTIELNRPVTSLPLQDALRTIGYGLEAARVRRARLKLTATGLVVETTGAYAVRSYGWDDVAVQVRVQRGLRQPGGPATDPWTLTRWSVLLRATGLLLDSHGIDIAEIEAAVAPPEAPRDCQLSVRVGDEVVLTAAAIHERLDWLRLRHAADRPEPLAQPAGARRLWRPAWPRR